MVDKLHINLVECTIPILPVRQMAASVEFFTRTLGFQRDWGEPELDDVCSVSRDGSAIMLMKRPGEFTPAWVWIGLEDASLFDEYRSRGVTVLQEPANYSWAYEMKFADLDGNVLWCGTEPRSDLPFRDQG